MTRKTNISLHPSGGPQHPGWSSFVPCMFQPSALQALCWFLSASFVENKRQKFGNHFSTRIAKKISEKFTAVEVACTSFLRWNVLQRKYSECLVLPSFTFFLPLVAVSQEQILMLYLSKKHSLKGAHFTFTECGENKLHYTLSSINYSHTLAANVIVNGSSHKLCSWNEFDGCDLFVLIIKAVTSDRSITLEQACQT